MKRLLFLVVCSILIAQFVSAHAVERESIIRNAGEYNIKFSTDPQFPVTGRLMHMNFEVWDNSGQVLSDATIQIVLHTQERTIQLDTNKKADHYDVEYVFDSAGEYTLIPFINGEQVDTSFTIHVDTFGSDELLKVAIIAFFILLLLKLMYKDCMKRKHE